MLTIGHSTLPIEIFLGALRQNGVECLVDIRTVPRSRFNPQFGTEQLSRSIQQAGMEYLWMRELGGLRHPRPDSINMGWRNTSFRGYADYMQTGPFAEALARLIAMDCERTAAIMCSEAVPWRCHRSLVGDALLVHGCTVEDIFVAANGTATRKPHKLTPFAQVEGQRLWYPPEPASQPELPLTAGKTI